MKLLLFIVACSVTSTIGSQHVYSSYQNLPYCAASYPIQYPKNIQDVQNIVIEAISNNMTVKGLGNRHSQTDTICTEGIPISLQKIHYKIMNEDSTVTVGAGANMSDITGFLQEKGRSLIHIAEYSSITIGGAIGSGSHGSSLRHTPTLSDQAVKFTIVDGTGKIQTIEKEEELRAFRVHLGLLGIIVDITLKTVPLFKITMESTLESDSILLDGTAIREAKLYDFYRVAWFPSLQTAAVRKGFHVNDTTTPGNAKLYGFPDQTKEEVSKARNDFETLQATKNMKELYAMEKLHETVSYSQLEGTIPLISEDGENFSNPATGFAHNLFSFRCSPGKCPWDFGNQSIVHDVSSMAFDMKKLSNIMSMAKDILTQIPAPFPAMGIIIRFCKSSESYMSVDYGQDTVHMEWVNMMRQNPFEDAIVGLGSYQALLQMLSDQGGKSHWGKTGFFYHRKEALAKNVENLAPFVKIMKKYDPNGVFMNKFGRRLTGQSNEFSINPNIKHCALNDYCLCKENTDCAINQRCALLKGYRFCQDTDDQRKTYNDGRHEL